MLYSRRCLEVMITDLCEIELNRPRKTEPLKGIIDKLNKEEKVPAHIITSMDHLNSLSTYGAHPKEFDPEQVKPVLNNLTTIIKWYLKYKNIQTISEVKLEEAKYESKEPVDTREGMHKPKKRLIFLISGLLLVVAIIIVLLFVFNIIGGEKQIKELEKSIAVLPFINDSPDEENTYFINGIMDEILNNLQTIKDLRVISRTSVEQYRNTTKSISEIAKELGVNYIVEGSGQKYGNTFGVSVQLIMATVKESHLWAKSYDNEILEVKDIFSIKRQIAQAIASELKAIISPEEKRLIEITPTKILKAYDFFLQARNEHMKYWLGDTNIDDLNKAMTLYRQALQYDSTYAQAYSGLAWGYMDKYFAQIDLETNFVDSMIIYANKALSYNDRLDEAFYIKGNYYNITGDYDRVLKEYSEAIEINPNFSMAYWSRAHLHFLKTFDIFSAFEDCFMAIQLEHGPLRPGMMRDLGGTFRNFGFQEIASYYYKEALKLDNDSLSYLSTLAILEEYHNDSRAVELYKEVLKKDPSNLNAFWGSLGCYERLGNYEESYNIVLNILQIWDERDYSPQYGWEVIGFAFWKTGHLMEAKKYFNKQIDICERTLKLDPNDDYGKMVLAMVYAVLGEKEKALKFLNVIKDLIYVRYNKGNISSQIFLYWLKYDPLLENLRSDPGFQKMVIDYENVYNITYERFKAWLKEKGMLTE